MPSAAAATGALESLVRAYADARTALEAHREAEKPLIQAKMQAERELFDLLEDLNLRSARHAELGLFTLDDKAEPVLDDPTAFVAWAEKAMPEILTPNRMRLGAIVREVLRGERDLHVETPEGLPPGVTATFRRSISWRRS